MLDYSLRFRGPIDVHPGPNIGNGFSDEPKLPCELPPGCMHRMLIAVAEAAGDIPAVLPRLLRSTDQEHVSIVHDDGLSREKRRGTAPAGPCTPTVQRDEPSVCGPDIIVDLSHRMVNSAGKPADAHERKR